jgi:Abortive infection C-terminus
MRKIIPSPVIAIVAEIISQRETHASMDNLFMYAGAPGNPPDGSKWVKAQDWLRRVNLDEAVQPLQVLGRLIETCMEEMPPENDSFDEGPHPTKTADQEKIAKILGRYEFQYVKGGSIVGLLGAPSKTLEEFVRDKDVTALEHEFNRALENVDKDPREAVSAASNILETLCKVYIEERGLEMPAKQDLKPVWNIVRKDLGFDPGRVEDQDLQTILTGLLALVDGIGALRTHASSAHGAGKKSYKLESRHSRLAVHSAHTIALFILESWERKKK